MRRPLWRQCLQIQLQELSIHSPVNHFTVWTFHSVDTALEVAVVHPTYPFKHLHLLFHPCYRSEGTCDCHKLSTTPFVLIPLQRELCYLIISFLPTPWWINTVTDLLVVKELEVDLSTLISERNTHTQRSFFLCSFYSQLWLWLSGQREIQGRGRRVSRERRKAKEEECNSLAKAESIMKSVHCFTLSFHFSPFFSLFGSCNKTAAAQRTKRKRKK